MLFSRAAPSGEEGLNERGEFGIDPGKDRRISAPGSRLGLSGCDGFAEPLASRCGLGKGVGGISIGIPLYGPATVSFTCDDCCLFDAGGSFPGCTC
jgi:hypothetical protein